MAMEKKEHLYKVLVIGDLGTGKTSIIKRYVHNFFSVHYRATVSFSSYAEFFGSFFHMNSLSHNDYVVLRNILSM